MFNIFQRALQAHYFYISDIFQHALQVHDFNIQGIYIGDIRMFHIFRRALRAPYFNISEISWCLLSESVPLWNLHFIWKGWQIPDTFLFSLWEFSMRKQHAQIFHNIYLIQWLILEIEKWQDIFPSHWCNYFPLCHWFSVERCFFMNKITVKKGSFCHY